MSQSIEMELHSLKGKIVKMGVLVGTQIEDSIKCLVESDLSLAHQTIKNDALLNAMDVEIDEECIRLLTLDQLETCDLRFITTAMKITTDLERMSDLTKDICKHAIVLTQEPLLKPYIDLPRMTEAAIMMVRETLEAFVNKDVHLAQKVCADVPLIDDLSDQIFRELLDYMLGDSATIARAIRISFISKNIERIGDHATDIAERVVYLIEGKKTEPPR